MLGKLQSEGFLWKGLLSKGILRIGQNHPGQFSLYQTRLDTLVSPMPKGCPSKGILRIGIGESSLSGYFSHTGRPSVPIPPYRPSGTGRRHRSEVL